MKTKTMIAIIASALTIVSCKKNYSCECVSKLTDPSSGATMTKTETQPINAKLSSKQATASCNQTAKQVTENLYYYGDGTYNVTTNCDVK